MLSIRCRHRSRSFTSSSPFILSCVYLWVLRFLATPFVSPCLFFFRARWMLGETFLPRFSQCSRVSSSSFVLLFRRCLFTFSRRKFNNYFANWKWITCGFVEAIFFIPLGDWLIDWLFYDKQSFYWDQNINIWLGELNSTIRGTLYCLLGELIAVPRQDDSRNFCSFNGSGSLWIG